MIITNICNNLGYNNVKIERFTARIASYSFISNSDVMERHVKNRTIKINDVASFKLKKNTIIEINQDDLDLLLKLPNI